ncbi:exosortase H-associated membrane protein [Comamonas sp. J-3]|uniref:exosortase H-associated membrane protein n=1 Tax=Comamonas trifloxystrobinivorans TaxID=3350256 RepID=UPI00372BFC08
MKRLNPIQRFALLAFVGIIVLTTVWTKLSPWISYPVAVISKYGLEDMASGWVKQVQIEPGKIEVDTNVGVANAQTGGRWVEISIDGDPGRYAYGFPIFLALLLAAWRKGRVWRAIVGYIVLLPFQAFSISTSLLMQMVLATNLDLRLLKISQGQLEGLAYGFQLGSLVLPTLVPFLLWLWLDRQFVNDVLVEAWKKSVQPKLMPKPVVKPPPPPPPEQVIRPAESGAEISHSVSITLPPRKNS